MFNKDHFNQFTPLPETLRGRQCLQTEALLCQRSLLRYSPQAQRNRSRLRYYISPKTEAELLPENGCLGRISSAEGATLNGNAQQGRLFLSISVLHVSYWSGTSVIFCREREEGTRFTSFPSLQRRWVSVSDWHSEEKSVPHSWEASITDVLDGTQETDRLSL